MSSEEAEDTQARTVHASEHGLASNQILSAVQSSHSPDAGSPDFNDSRLNTIARTDASTDNTAFRKKNVDRNRKPCGNCSSSKRKCNIISMEPLLCQRCHNHGLTACPPHTPWGQRRQDPSVHYASSPELFDQHSGDVNSTTEIQSQNLRMRSPSHSSSNMSSPMSTFTSPSPGIPQMPSPGSIPDLQASYQKMEMERELNVLQPCPSKGLGWMSEASGPAEPAATHSPPANVGALPWMDLINVHGLQYLLPVLPVCHVCNTTYDLERLQCALTMLIPAVASPRPSGHTNAYDQHEAYSHVTNQPAAPAAPPSMDYYPGLGHGHLALNFSDPFPPQNYDANEWSGSFARAI